MFGNYPPMHEIVPNLWLGSIEAARVPFLKSHAVSAILSIVGDPTICPRFSAPFYQTIINLSDGSPYSYQDLYRGLSFIDEHLSSGHGVLVHCIAGISRSTSMVAGYLMYKYKMDPLEALNSILSKRDIANPLHKTFESVQKQLFPNLEYQCQRCGKYRTHLSKIKTYNKIHQKDRNMRVFCSCPSPLDITR